MRIAATALIQVALGVQITLCVTPLHGAAAEPSQSPPGADGIALVATDGEATLKLCRDWLFRQQCREYGHIDVPERIARGDSFEVTFGSNPKTMRFRVKSVLPGDGGGGCVVIPEHEDTPQPPAADEPADMLIIKDCTILR
ncbi:hypothetical protein [Azospirillum sp. sgz302134]